MDKTEAKIRLSFHSGRNSHIDDPRWENGFLGSLRPFRGDLHQENFHDIMACLQVLREDLSAPLLDREVIADLMNIIHLPRAWASPEGMLGRNHLLSADQTKHLLAWIDIIEDCLMYLLDDAAAEAFAAYEDYLNDDYF